MLLRRKKKKEKKKAALAAAAAAQLTMSYDSSDLRSPMHQRPHSALPGYAVECQLEDLLEDSGSDEISVEDFGLEHANAEGRGISPTQSLPHLLSRGQTNPEQVLKKRMSQPAIMANIPPDSLSLQNMPIHYGPPSTVVTPATVSLQPPPPPQPSVVMVAQSTPSSQDAKKSMPAHVTARENATHKKGAAHPLARVSPQKAELIRNVVELGLGRGVDATSRTPWTNKSTFQVRRVQPSVVETKELGTVGCYNHAIQSTQQMDQLFQASLSPPEAPVSIHVEDESNRTTNSTRRVVGRRVVNSTVGFQTDFEEKCSNGDSIKFSRDSFLVPRDPSEVVFNTQGSSHTFEERVSQWILHRIAHRYAIVGQKFEFFRAEGGSSMERLAKLVHSKAVPKTEEYIKAGCKELVQGLRITHYVTSMKLGAVEYRVISEGEYNKKLAKGGAFGLDALVESFVKTPKNQSKKEASKCSQLRKLGNINQEGRVEPRSSDETVISIEVQPIARLFRLPALKLAIQDAVEEYMDSALATEGAWVSRYERLTRSRPILFLFIFRNSLLIEQMQNVL